MIAAGHRKMMREPIHSGVSRENHRSRRLRFYDSPIPIPQSRFPTPDFRLFYSIPSFFNL
ncbi:hypothetical protein ABZP12_01016 [Xanthomonas euvesicatoria]